MYLLKYSNDIWKLMYFYFCTKIRKSKCLENKLTSKSAYLTNSLSVGFKVKLSPVAPALISFSLRKKSKMFLSTKSKNVTNCIIKQITKVTNRRLGASGTEGFVDFSCQNICMRWLWLTMIDSWAEKFVGQDTDGVTSIKSTWLLVNPNLEKTCVKIFLLSDD